MGIEVMTYLGEDIWAVPYYIDPEQGGEGEHVWLPDWRFSAPEGELTIGQFKVRF